MPKKQQNLTSNHISKLKKNTTVNERFFFTNRCTFDNNENCMEWLDKLLKASSPPRVLEELFAFFHYAWSKEKRHEDTMARIELQKALLYDETTFRNEVYLFVWLVFCLFMVCLFVW